MKQWLKRSLIVTALLLASLSPTLGHAEQMPPHDASRGAGKAPAGPEAENREQPPGPERDPPARTVGAPPDRERAASKAGDHVGGSGTHPASKAGNGAPTSKDLPPAAVSTDVGTDTPAAAATEHPAATTESKPPMDRTAPPPKARALQETAPVAQPLPESPPASRPSRIPKDKTLTVVTWNGAYAEAQKRVMFAPFAADTDSRLEVVSHGGDMARITAEHIAARGWDLIELNAATVRRGCTEGWLEPIAPGSLPGGVEGDAPEADYLPGALTPCGVGSAAWSAVVVFDRRANFESAPTDISALFDLPRFPGKRALPKQAPYTLELALMADGVPPARVYEVLATPSGQDRAFAKLSAIRHAIVWWEDAAAALELFRPAPPELLEDVVMGVAFNGRAFTTIVRARPFLRILWSGQMYQFNYWALPAAAAENEVAKKLLRQVSLPERQARLTQWFPYGPARRSALPFVGQHAAIDLDMADFVPTMPRNMTKALRFDDAWWTGHGKPLKRRFAAWLARPAPTAPADQFVPPVPAKSIRHQAEMTVQ